MRFWSFGICMFLYVLCFCNRITPASSYIFLLCILLRKGARRVDNLKVVELAVAIVAAVVAVFKAVVKLMDHISKRKKEPSPAAA